MPITLAKLSGNVKKCQKTCFSKSRYYLHSCNIIWRQKLFYYIFSYMIIAEGLQKAMRCQYWSEIGQGHISDQSTVEDDSDVHIRKHATMAFKR